MTSEHNTTDELSFNMENAANSLKEQELSKYKQNMFEEIFTKPSTSNDISNISITSLEEGDSSTTYSDSECEDISSIPACIKKNHLRDTSQNRTNSNDIIVVNNREQNLNEATKVPPIGNIAIQNSTDVTFGNKTFYHGPVTIKQFLMDKNKWKLKENGTDNLSYERDDEDTTQETTQSKQRKEEKKNFYLSNKRSIIITTLTAAIVVIGIIVLIITHTIIDDRIENPGDGDDSRKNIPIDSTIDEDLLPGGGSSLRFIARSQWIAQPPSAELNDLELPSTRVIIAHTATENCSTQAVCTFRVRLIQTFHIESQGWDDIGYNFLVGGDGAAYEGRGWDKEGAHTKGFNKKSICIAFIGIFTKLTPPERQLRAAQMLIEEGVKQQKLVPDYKLYGHRQLMGSESPGEALYAIIKTWPNWSNKSLF